MGTRIKEETKKEFGVAVKALIKRGDRFLILHKSDEEDVNPNSYDIPGGRIKFGETLREALKREVLEEVGLNVEIKNIIEAWTFTKGDFFQLVGLNYLCLSDSDEVKLSSEHDSYEWVCAKDILAEGKYPEFLVKVMKLAIKDSFS